MNASAALKTKFVPKLRDNKRFITQCAVLFAVYMFMHAISLYAVVFASDEEDVTLGGKAIARGFLLYKDYISQHMPVTYYISAVFELLGAHSIYAQRFCFYLFYAAWWVYIFVNYRDVADGKALALYPVLFHLVTYTYELGTQVLSEHIAGIGFVLLFLEYLRFKNFGKLTIRSCVILSVAILLTFGTIFIAAFGLMVIVLAVFLKEIIFLVKSRKEIKSLIKNEILKFLKMVGIMLAPWSVYLIYLLATGTLEIAYFSAYTVNRTIYPKYMGGGLGSSVAKAFGESVSTAFMWLTEYNSPFNDSDANKFIHIIIIVLFAGFLAHLFKKRGALDVIVSLGFVIYLGGVRGMFNFHGAPCVEVMCLMGSIFFIEGICKGARNIREVSLPVLAITSFCSIWLIKPMSQEITNMAGFIYDKPYREIDSVLQEITDEDEAIWNCSSENDLFMRADRVSVYNFPFTIWGYEAHSERVIEQLEEEGLPRICILDTDYANWDTEFMDYGEDLVDYIEENYTLLEGDETEDRLYVRNDLIDTIPEKWRPEV